MSGAPGGTLHLRAGGLDTFARVGGAPHLPPVVLVHGFVISGRYMVPLLRCLTSGFRVYAPDLPGFGRSATPPHALDVPELADALGAWMDAAGLERAHLVANSMGCQVATSLAARHPARVERMVLVGPTVEAGSRTIPRQALRLLRGAPHERPSLLLLQVRDWLRMGPRRIWRLAHHALADRIEERLPRVGAPTLVVRGGSDRLASRAWTERVAALLPRGRFVELPGEGHALNYSAAPELAALVAPFLRGDSPPADPVP